MKKHLKTFAEQADDLEFIRMVEEGYTTETTTSNSNIVFVGKPDQEPYAVDAVLGYCTCEDFRKRGKALSGHTCKHVRFALRCIHEGRVQFKMKEAA